ncbi:putative reverse transcriptase domain-containing protein [Tanacetum coccineum]
MPIPHGRPYRYHPNEPIHMMNARKRVGPFLVLQLAVGHPIHSTPDLPSTLLGPSTQRVRCRGRFLTPNLERPHGLIKGLKNWFIGLAEVMEGSVKQHRTLEPLNENRGNGNGRGNGGEENENGGTGHRNGKPWMNYGRFEKMGLSEPIDVRGLAYAMILGGTEELITEVMVPDEEDKVERFIGEAQGFYAARLCLRIRRGWESNIRDNRGQQPSFKRQNTSGQNVARAYTAGTNERKGYAGSLPYCNKCRLHHEGLCIMRCGNCKKVGHQTRDCRGLL